MKMTTGRLWWTAFGVCIAVFGVLKIVDSLFGGGASFAVFMSLAIATVVTVVFRNE